MNAKATYRVVLSGPLIAHLVMSARTNPSAPFSAEIKQRLGPMHTRIVDETSKPMNIEREKVSLKDSLGFETTPKTTDFIARRALAYAKWQVAPESCSETELTDVATHRYNNKLMDAAEIAAFELKMFDSFDPTIPPEDDEGETV